MLKQRRDSFSQFQAAGRMDLADKENFEIGVIQGYMPAQLSAYIKPRMKGTVIENGRPLGPAESLHQLIRDQGGGAFSVWGTNIYLSSSDRTDCNNNGRQYAIMAEEL